MNKKRIIPWFLAMVLLFTLCLSVTACGEKSTDTTIAESPMSNNNAANGKINIATKNTPEQNILANLAKILIEKKWASKPTLYITKIPPQPHFWKK